MGHSLAFSPARNSASNPERPVSSSIALRSWIDAAFNVIPVPLMAVATRGLFGNPIRQMVLVAMSGKISFIIQQIAIQINRSPLGAYHISLRLVQVAQPWESTQGATRQHNGSTIGGMLAALPLT